MAQKTVANFAELKAAVEDAETTDILVSADITYSGGIRIPTSKTVLTIDCGGHTITDGNSTSYADALYVPAGMNSAVVTVKNAVWSGRNYYGVVCVYDDAKNAGVTVVLDNVTYVGPQMIYNRYGTTRVVDCTVRIEKNGSTAAAQEFCEGNRLVFGGKVGITAATASNAVVWFPFAGSAFTVEKDASVTIDAPNTYMFYTDSAAKPIFTFGEGSNTRISVKNGLFYSSGSGAHIASSCVISERAALYVTSSANNGVPLFKCAGEFSVKNGASLFLIMPTKGNSPLLYFSSAASVTFDSPKNVLLYSNGGKVFSFNTGSTSAPNAVNLTAERVNLWTTAKIPFESAGGFDDTPSSTFLKADGQAVTITQQLSSNAVISTAGNLTDGDEGYPVSAANYDLTKVAVLAAGDLGLSVDGINDLAASVTGTTDPNSAIMYSAARLTANGTADGEGKFTVGLSEKPIAGEIATVKSNKNFLTATTAVTVAGSVSVTYLPDIPFNAFAVPKRSATVKRTDSEWFLELTDTRPDGGKWSLYLSLQSPLQSADETIENAVIFVDGQMRVIRSVPELVASGVSEKAGIIRVSWSENEGVLLGFDDETEYEKGNYSSTLLWSVDFE